MNSDYERVGPVGEFLKKNPRMSTYKVAEIIGTSQITVWRHATGQSRIGIDAQEAYNQKLGISLKEMRAWNRKLAETRGQNGGMNGSGNPGANRAPAGGMS